LLDLSILVMFLSITSSLGDVRHSQGTELVWLVCYFPVIIPTVFALARLLPSIEVATNVLEAWFGPFGGILADWVLFSVTGAVQSLLIVLLARSILRMRREIGA
jgi:hypothetical protein